MDKTARKEPRIEIQTDGSTILLLSRPYEAEEGRTIDRLVFPEEASVFHLRAMDKADGEVAKEIAFLAAVTEQKISTLNRLKAVDFFAAQRAAKPLMGKPPETGATS